MRGSYAVMLAVALAVMPARADDVSPGQAALDRAIAALPPEVQIHYADATTDPASGAVTLAHLTVAAGGTLLLAAEHATVTGATGAGTADAPFGATRIELSGIGESNLAGGASADRATITDVAIGPGAPDTGGVRFDLVTRALLAVQASQIAIEGLHRQDGSKVGSMVYEGIAHGHVAHAVLKDMRADLDNLKFATIEGTDLDVAGLVRLIYAPQAVPSQAAPAPAAPQADTAPPRPLLGKLDFRDMVAVDNGGTFKQDLLELSDLRMLPHPDADAAGGSPDTQTGGGVAAGGRRVLARLARSVAIGGFKVEGIAFTPQNEPGGFTVANFAINGYEGGKVASAMVGATDFDIRTKQVAFGWKHVEVHGLDFSRTLDALASEAGLSLQIMNAPALSRLFTYLGVSLDGLHVRVKDAPPLTVDRIALENSTDKTDGSVPLHSTFDISRFYLPFAMLAVDSDDQAAIRAFGRDSLTADLKIATDWDNVSHVLQIAPYRIVLDDLATLDMKATLGGFDIAAFSGGTGKMAAAAFAITFVGADAQFTDASLVDRLIAVYAQQHNIAPDAAKAKLVAQLEDMKSPLPSRPLLPRQLAAFIRRPGTITASLHPPAPVPGASLFADKFDEAAKALNLQVTVK
jgi:hypothetical protein